VDDVGHELGQDGHGSLLCSPQKWMPIAAELLDLRALWSFGPHGLVAQITIEMPSSSPMGTSGIC
jgi:hypothetical protein